MPIAGVDERGLPIWGQLDNNSGQDHYAWTSQGPRTKRYLEKLGQSDMGIILFRRMLSEQIQIVEDGGEPMNTFRDPATNDIVWLPFDRMGDEEIQGKRAVPKRAHKEGGQVISHGASGKFKPWSIEYAKRIGAPIPPPFPESARTVVEVSPG